MNKTSIQEKKITDKLQVALTVIAIVTTIVAAAALVLYSREHLKLRSANNQLQIVQAQLNVFESDPSAQARQETDQLINKIGQLIELPTGEFPTLATVTDVSKLKDQLFFVNSEVGDKVLIYTIAKQAILYRPSTNKIIAVAPLNIGNQSTASSPKVTK